MSDVELAEENVIDDVIEESQEQDEVTESPEVNEEQEEVPVKEEAEQPEDKQESSEQSEHDVVFPKKALNAINRRNKKISKLEYELSQLRQATQSEQPKQEAQENTAPREDDFDTWSEYNAAVIKHQVEDAMKANQPEKISPEQVQEQQWVTERSGFVEKQAADLVTEIPDFADIVQSNADLLNDIPPELERTFLALDNPSMAFYNLAKEDKLEAVLNMPVHMATVEMMNAQNKSYAAPKKVSTAPRPIKSAKGSGSVTKNMADMNADEIAEYFSL